jgi:indoleamine 2,3-dioxygenase
MDMRDYRPKPFRDLLSWVYENNQDIIDKLLDTGDERTSEILLKIYKEIYNFRNGHWQFVQKYIMAQTKYPKATGGTGIINWLPNQIKATIDAMESVLIRSEEKYKKGLILLILGEHRRDICKMLELYDRQMKILHNREIIVDGKGNVLKEDYDEKKIYSLNKQFDQNDI